MSVHSATDRPSRRALLAAAAILIASSLAAPAARAAAPGEMTEGEVRKVDKENRRITLKHGEIRNLGMPAMTMVFQVGNAAMLEKVRPGDKVRFKATNTDGTLTVTELVPTK